MKSALIRHLLLFLTEHVSKSVEAPPGEMPTMLTTFIFHCVKTETLLFFFLKQNPLIRSPEVREEVPHLSAQEQITTLIHREAVV